MPVYYTKVERNATDNVQFLDPKKRRFSRSRLGFLSGSVQEFSALDVNYPLISCPRVDQSLNANEELVETTYGNILIAHQGSDLKEKKPVIVTFHDLGMNHAMNFEGFFDLTDSRILLKSFSVVHINAPGQERFATSFPEGYIYPTMDDLAHMVKEIMDKLDIKSAIGFGSGVGANILLRVALRFDNVIDGLFLINPFSGKASWSEWFYHKKNIRSLRNNNRSSLLPLSVQDFLMEYHFGSSYEERDTTSREVLEMYRSAFKGIQMNPYNLSLFIESFINRTDLRICREVKETQPRVQAAIITSAFSDQMTIEETVCTNARLDPSKTTWMKMSDCGMVLEERPHQTAQVFRLFLQGLGFTLKAYEKRRALMAGSSMPCLPTSDRKISLFEI